MHVDTYSTALHAHDPAALIARCREVGVEHVSLALDGMPGVAETGAPDWPALRAYVGQLKDAGIAAPVAMTSFGRDPSVVLSPGDHLTTIGAKLRTIDVLAATGIGTLLHYVNLVQSPDPADDDRYWAGLVEFFGKMVRRAEDVDVRIANHAIWRCMPTVIRDEALRQGATMAGYRAFRAPLWDGPYLLTSAEHVQRLLSAVPSDNNGVCLCTGMHIMGGDVPALIDAFAGKYFYAQMRDVRGRWPEAREALLGTGDLDFAEILRRLTTAGYDGTIGPEHLSAINHPNEDGDSAYMAGAVAFLKEKLAALH